METLQEIKPETLSAKLIIPAQTEKILIIDSIENSTITLEAGSRLTFILLSFNGWTGLKRLAFEFTGPGSELTFLCFMVGKNQNIFQFETFSKHLSTQTKAHFFLRSVMFDSSMVDYKGNLNIHKKAQLTDTYLSHQTLLLSDKARARTIPALEIEADDVKAGHAATIGKVDKDLMFYLQSRGINKMEAEQMLISGFFEEQLRLIPDHSLQEKIRQELTHQLLF